MRPAMLPATHEPIVIEHGQAGHWPPPDGIIVQRIDAPLRATPPQIAAMLVGAMIGRDARGTDRARRDAAWRPQGR